MSEAMVDQRATGDRRTFSWQTIFFGFTRSRRHNLRRDLDAEVIFLDWHHPWLFFLAVGTMLLSCLDAFMTLQLLDRGMIEANPVMAAMLGHGTTVFAVSKMLMTGTSVLILVFLAKSRFLNRFRTGIFLTVFFSLYACLICYEFVFLIRDM
ncbi:MAG: DUF5658 family protein [Gammaproteobacteria bacterium]|nr:DUF5658 family protein [Gammaproteobacteria bacterium]